MAVLFAVVTGANDGGAILTAGLKLPGPRIWVALATLAVAVVVVPLVLGTAVAATFGSTLVSFEGSTTPVIIGVLAALAVVAVLTRLGRPTSLTLATVGGLAGAGLGYGLPVSYGAMALILALGLAAPLVGGTVAFGVSRGLGPLSARGLGRVHRVGFPLLCVAYAANDGQKMLAVAAVALGDMPGPAMLVVIAALFAAGTVYGLPRVGRSLGGRLLAVRPVHAVSAELAAAGTVLGCAGLGTPVSMTQATAGGLVGAGVTHGTGKVRWYATTKIVTAWLSTLPAAVALAAVCAAGAAVLE